MTGLLAVAALGLCQAAYADPTVHVAIVYSSSGTTWSAYAIDQTPDSDGLACVCFKVGNVLTAYNVSPQSYSFVGDGSGDIQDEFGFSGIRWAANLGGGTFEIISGQSPGDLQSGAVDPNTNCALFLRHIGQQTVTYTIENDNGTQTQKTVSPSQQTHNSITGYWVKIAQGTRTANSVPTVVPYAGGITAGANFVDVGETTTEQAEADAVVVAE
jgi:hypothetical protein